MTWASEDPSAPPSIQDLGGANLAIEQLEGQLSLAPMVHKGADDPVDNLSRDIYKRRAWLAPISRLNTGFLSHTFELCGEEDRRCPLRIEGVSTYWGVVVLATPRAWALVDLKSCNNHKAIECFFERSG